MFHISIKQLCDRKSLLGNIKGSINLAYSENANLEVPIRLSFQGLLLFLGKEKSAKCTNFATGHCFFHPPLIYHYSKLSFRLVCIAKVCEQSTLTNVMKNPLLIVRVIFQCCSTKTLILSILRR